MMYWIVASNKWRRARFIFYQLQYMGNISTGVEKVWKKDIVLNNWIVYLLYYKHSFLC